MSRTTFSRDFWLFFGGQTISNLGSSFTQLALPLLVYQLTGSAVNLGIATAAYFLPYLLFGLLIGAWVDRVNRKRLMIWADLLRALVIFSIPALAWADQLSVWWIYAGTFVFATLTIAFDSGEFAAVPSLVSRDDLVTANGRIQASYAGANVIGPLLAGALVGAGLAIETVLVFDAASFLVSAAFLVLIRRSFNEERDQAAEPTHILADVKEGLRYVFGHPVLRAISLMMALINFVVASTFTQLVLFGKERLDASDAQVAYLFSAGSVGIVALSLLAGPLRKRLSFSVVALGALALEGLILIAFSFTTVYWLALPLWAACAGLGILFNINTGSLRQAIVPSQMLGRVVSIASVLAWSAIPAGTLLGGWLIEATGDVALVYALIGVLTFVIATSFSFTALGRADRYLPADGEEPALPPHPGPVVPATAELDTS